MARKLNSTEAKVFVGEVLNEGQSLVSDADIVLRALAERRDEELELTPESGAWFGDIFPGAFGSHY